MQRVFDKTALPPLSDIAERYGLSVKNNRCCCPFHESKDNRSMLIYHDGYTCFKCGTGDQIDFVQRLHGITFKETIEKLTNDFLGGVSRSIPVTVHKDKKHSKEASKEFRTGLLITLSILLLRADDMGVSGASQAIAGRPFFSNLLRYKSELEFVYESLASQREITFEDEENILKLINKVLTKS